MSSSGLVLSFDDFLPFRSIQLRFRAWGGGRELEGGGGGGGGRGVSSSVAPSVEKKAACVQD